MPVRCDAASNHTGNRTGALPSSHRGVTATGWFRRNATSGDWQGLLVLDTGADTVGYCGLWEAAGSNQIFWASNAAGDGNIGLNAADDTWYFLAWRTDPTAGRDVYWRSETENALSNDTDPSAMSATAPTNFRLSDSPWGEDASWDFAAIKLFDRELSAAEILIESYFYLPKTQDCIGCYPLVDAALQDPTRDFMGQATLDWANTPTIVDDGPRSVVWGAPPVALGSSTGVSNDIAAALTTTATVGADLDASGSLSAAQALALTLAADLDAQGQLSAAVSLVLSVAADLEATGNLQASTNLTLSALADLDALGSLSAAASLALSVAADLEAVGSLQAAATLVVTVAADIQSAANNALDANLQTALSIAADIDAAGMLAATPQAALTIGASLTAPGELQAPLSATVTSSADLRGSGALASVLPIAIGVAADINAPGELQAAAELVLSVAAGLTDANAGIVREAAITLTTYARDHILSSRRERNVLTAGHVDDSVLRPKKLH